MKIVATYNIKGGVGKTTAAVNLSYLAAADGQRVLLADLDPQGAASFLFRVRPRVKGGGAGLIRGNSDLDKAIREPTSTVSTCSRPTSPYATSI